MLKLELTTEEVLFLRDLLYTCEEDIETSLENAPEPQDAQYMTGELATVKKVLKAIDTQEDTWANKK